MEYQTCLWKDPFGDEHLLVRAHFIYGKILQGGVFQKYLSERFCYDKNISLIRDDNGVHTVISEGMPLNLADDWLDDLEWQDYRWGEEDNA